MGRFGNTNIESLLPSFAGDYAPLITHSVYRFTFTERGLPSSKSPVAFQVQITELFPGHTSWTNETATHAASASCGVGPVCVTFFLPHGVYEFIVAVDHSRGTTFLPVPAMGFVAVLSPHGGVVGIDFVTEHGSSPSRPGKIDAALPRRR